MENTFKREEGLDPITEGELIGMNMIPCKPIRIIKKIGAILIGMPFLFENGDPTFHSEMVKLGLRRRGPWLCGLKHKIIWADEHDYILLDCDNPEEYCKRYKMKATYSKEEFITTLKKQLEEQ